MLNRLFSRNQQPHPARQLVEDGALLLDVRTPAEHAAGHIAGSRNIPVQELGARMHELGAPGQRLVVYCRSGARSAAATRMLQRAGHEVTDIGPMHAW